jgi:Domain of unknown function (DUF4395)
MASIFSFPNPVNEKAARTVAAVVCVLSLLTLATGWYWLLAVLAYGFIARVLTGPTLSPLGRIASALVAPRLGAPRPVPGPPKRFAPGIGAVLTTTAAIFALVAHDHTVAIVLLAAMVLASGLESIFALCIGCELFSVLMRLGVVPASICAECANVELRGGPA